MSAAVLVHRARQSPTFWVMGLTLAPALVCTLLAKEWYPYWWKLVGYFWYSIPANSFVYLPHEPAVVYASAIYQPWAVAVVGGFATTIAAIVDYFVVRKVFEYRRVAPVKQTSFYKSAVRYFYWQPWATIALFALLPFPYYPIRVLAPSADYPLWRYVSACVAGRVPRYYLLALGGAWMPVPTEYILLMAVVIIVATVLLCTLGARRAAGKSRTRIEAPLK